MVISPQGRWKVLVVSQKNSNKPLTMKSFWEVQAKTTGIKYLTVESSNMALTKSSNFPYNSTALVAFPQHLASCLATT